MSDERERTDVRRRSTALQPRTREKRTERQSSVRQGRSALLHHPRLLTCVVLIACLASLVAIIMGVFTVHRVDVVGTNLPANMIVQAADVTGQNIFTVRSDEVVDRLTMISLIQVTRVETSFPDRVTVYASRRQAAVGWRTAAGLHLVDKFGIVIESATSTTLPIVTGGTRPPDPNTIVAVQYAATSLPPAPSGAVAGFGLDPVTGLSISGKSGWRALVGSGSAQSLVARVATLGALLTRLGSRAQRVSFVDLRYKEPYLRYAGR